MVCTTGVVRTVVLTHTQICSVLSDPQVLQPLELHVFQPLLANRYVALQRDPGHPWRSPVQNAMVERRYKPFRRDLRGMLKTLEDRITALLGGSPPPPPAMALNPWA